MIDVGHRAVQHLQLAILQSERRRELRRQESERLDALGEDHEPVVRLARPLDPLLLVDELLDQVTVARDVIRLDRLHDLVERAQRRQVVRGVCIALRRVGLELLDAGRHGLEARGRAREQ